MKKIVRFVVCVIIIIFIIHISTVNVGNRNDIEVQITPSAIRFYYSNAE